MKDNSNDSDVDGCRNCNPAAVAYSPSAPYLPPLITFFDAMLSLVSRSLLWSDDRIVTDDKVTCWRLAIVRQGIGLGRRRQAVHRIQVSLALALGYHDGAHAQA